MKQPSTFVCHNDQIIHHLLPDVNVITFWFVVKKISYIEVGKIKMWWHHQEYAILGTLNCLNNCHVCHFPLVASYLFYCFKLRCLPNNPRFKQTWSFVFHRIIAFMHFVNQKKRLTKNANEFLNQKRLTNKSTNEIT